MRRVRMPIRIALAKIDSGRDCLLRIDVPDLLFRCIDQDFLT